jgi:hypothetical protein
MSGGPGSVTFGNASSVDTTATFSMPGVYTLCLATAYGALISNDYATITVVNTNTQNQVPYHESFEEYVNGERIGGINGWYVQDPNAAIVMTNNCTATYTNGYPIPGPHELVLNIDGAVSNMFQKTASCTNVWMDTILQCSLWVYSSPPIITSNAQFAAYVSTNGHMSVWNCRNPITPPYTNAWTQLPDTNIGSNQFIRLTVQSSYTRETNSFFKFRLWINGIAVTNPATWFYTANTNNNCLSRILAQGTFPLDDLVVTDSDPFVFWNIQASAVGRGMVIPAGSVLVPMNGTANFVISPTQTWYHVASVVVDGTNNIGAVTNYTFMNVVAPHTIMASFAADVAASNTPKWWLAQYYPSNQFDLAATNDLDGDGMKGSQEYIAGTCPTNQASAFQLSLSKSNEQIVVTCPTISAGAGYDGLTRYYEIEQCTNLLTGGTWQPKSGYTNIPGNGGVIACTNATPDSIKFYRARAWLL